MQTMYIGDSIHRLGINKNAIYTSRPVELIEKAEGEGYTLVGRLFVPVDDLNKMQEEIKRQGTPIFLANKQISEVN